MKQLLLLILRIYRAALSPFLGNHCRFYPSCSHYAEEAIDKKGAWAGSLKTMGRILKCHPFHAGGLDPVE